MAPSQRGKKTGRRKQKSRKSSFDREAYLAREEKKARADMERSRADIEENRTAGTRAPYKMKRSGHLSGNRWG